MRQPLRARALLPVSVAVMLLAPGGVQAQEPAPSDATMSAVPLPGGLAGARSALGEANTGDASTLLIDLIRRSFETPVGTKGLRRQETLRPLLELLGRARGSTTPSRDLVPLPLTPEIWTTAILGGKAGSGAIVEELLRSPAASLMYCALLALDAPTRQWFATKPALLTEIAERHAAAFLLAAPGIRIEGGALRVPGEAAAAPGWQALVGRPLSEPLEFVRALLAASEGRLAYFYGTAARLTPNERRVLLSLDVPAMGPGEAAGTSTRTAAFRRMAGVFERVAGGWDTTDRPFWRPSLDPALLVSDLSTDAAGVPRVPGTAAFWSAVLGDDHADRDRGGLADGPPADFTTLCEQIFNGGQAVIRTPYQQVLFASRRLAPLGALSRDLARDGVVAVRAVARYPALITALERARLTSIPIYAAAARRAAAIAAIDDERRARLEITQFQGALAIAGRALARGSIDEAQAADLIAALSAIELDDPGHLVEWLGRAASLAGSDGVRTDGGKDTLDDRVLALVSGPVPRPTDTVAWEGTRYRVDPASAEASRLRRLLGDTPTPYLTVAGSLAGAAAGLEATGATRATLTQQAEVVHTALATLECGGQDREQPSPSRDAAIRCRDVAGALARAARGGDVKAAARLSPRLRQLADASLARGLIELTYAIALGQPDATAILAGDAASRHDFGFDLPGFGRAGAWRRPAAGGDRVRDWHVTGAMLGLDVALAPLALSRVSTRPPSTRPTLNDEDRRVLTEVVALIEGPQLSAADHQAIVAALRRGRERLGAVRSDADLQAIAASLDLPPARRTLLSWTLSRPQVAPRLSRHELLLLGLGGPGVGGVARLDAWGASAEPRLGCSCLQVPLSGRGDLFSGRWHTGVAATRFPDLNLRLAEMLAELGMPAALLPPVLAAATWDLVLTVRSRDFDDWQALADFVDTLTPDRVEQYLALLTTDGPLVPVAEGSAPPAAPAPIPRFD